LTQTRVRWSRFLAAAACAALLGCLGPSDRTPGLRLRGEVVESVPADWSFTKKVREIELEAHTAFLLRHSVTIWCGDLDGALYVGARAPETKRWTRLVGRDPDVRLRIDGRIYEVTLSAVEDPDLTERVRHAYSVKYALPVPQSAESGASMRYWRVLPRAR
jgi:hypothetical protein